MTGKTAALQAQCLLSAFDSSQRRIHKSDFHVQFDEDEVPIQRKLCMQADFTFPELKLNDCFRPLTVISNE